jgi:hypothetical protein
MLKEEHMPIEVIGALEAATKISEIVEFIAKKKGELTKKPKAAAKDLALALDQIYATFQAVASEVASFQSLGASIDGLKEWAQFLPQLQGVVLRSRIKNAKGHCSVIGNIYHAHLDAWFRGALSEVDYLMAKSGFTILGEADEILFDQMLSIADTISIEAAAVEDPDVGREMGGRSRSCAVLTPESSLNGACFGRHDGQLE